MKKRIIYGLLIALLIVVICICGDKVIKKPEAVIASSELQEANKKESEEIIEPVAEVEEIEEEPLYYGLTYDALVEQINKSLNSTVSGYGEVFVSKSLELGVDPYLAVAIMLHETGCNWNCSRLVKECNNVGGKKGSGCGSYQYYESLEDGIKNLINYLSKNYFKKGLDTPKEINQKYASDQTWYKKINNYVKQIKNA